MNEQQCLADSAFSPSVCGWRAGGGDAGQAVARLTTPASARLAAWAQRRGLLDLSGRLYERAATHAADPFGVYENRAAEVWLAAGRFDRADAAFGHFIAAQTDPPPNVVTDASPELLALFRAQYMMTRAQALHSRGRTDDAIDSAAAAQTLAQSGSAVPRAGALLIQIADTWATLDQAERAAALIDDVIGMERAALDASTTAGRAAPADADEQAEANLFLAWALIDRMERTEPEGARDDAVAAEARDVLQTAEALAPPLHDEAAALRARLERVMSDAGAD